MQSDEQVQALIDAFVTVTSEQDESAILAQVVDLARMATASRYGAAVFVNETGITHLEHAGMTTRQIAVLPHPPLGHGVLGAVLAAGAPIRLDRLQDHAESVGFPLGHVPMTAFLGVPIMDEAQLLGAIYLTRPPGQGSYTEADEALVAALGRQAGHAVTAIRTTKRATELAEQLAAAGELRASALARFSDEVDPSEAIERILHAARTNLDMELAVISRFEGGVQQFVRVSGDGAAIGVHDGDSIDPGTAYCQLMLDDSAHAVIPDVLADPVAAALPATSGLGLRSYAGVPLRLPGGELYGSLCTLSRATRPLTPADRGFLAVLAELISGQLERWSAARAERARARAAIEVHLEPGALQVVVQPIVDLAQDCVSGVEVLSRFPDWPHGGPEAVFAAAAGVGLGAELELAAITAGLRVLDELPAPLYVSLNASPSTVLDPRLAGLLEGVDGTRVVLEVTEHAEVLDYGPLRAVLAGLKRSGVRCAIDDAGSGFASLHHVLSSTPDLVKLDRSLVADVDADRGRRALVRAMVGFCADLGIRLVAEGIETAEELAALRSLGVGFGQGYHLGRPGPVRDALRPAGIATSSDRR